MSSADLQEYFEKTAAFYRLFFIPLAIEYKRLLAFHGKHLHPYVKKDALTLLRRIVAVDMGNNLACSPDDIHAFLDDLDLDYFIHYELI